MTYKEILEIISPVEVDDIYFGGCKGCPGQRIPGAPVFTPACGKIREKMCKKCWKKKATLEQTRKAFGIKEATDDE